MVGIHKWFGRVHALRGVNFAVHRGEVVGLCGDNGAGKSTLIKVASGYHTADAGQIFFEGREVKLRSPKDARALGIETVYQEQALCPHLSIARNIFMGREPTTVLGLIDQRTMNEESMQALASMGLRLRSPHALVSALSGGQRQGVAIARAIHFKAKLVILDEPTIALSVKEVREVLDFVRHLRDQGVAVVFITHTLHHVFSVADRIVVLAHGCNLVDVRTKDTDVDELSDIIARGTLGDVVPTTQHAR
ncbi:MAG: ATP-binding cassette domain-containing protein [Anaerolineae bacterium]|nr:ATP-binding cassette domain-containing protein [Anaerolineae bacterium]MDW8070491.1 ATP-binding cassette domain-containing protein [Anaerolineae bacterium]